MFINLKLFLTAKYYSFFKIKIFSTESLNAETKRPVFLSLWENTKTFVTDIQIKIKP